MEHRNWQCPKCSHTVFDTDTFAATGGGLSKIFDIQNKKFSTVTCAHCKFTEIYRADTSTLGNVFDLFTT